MSKEHPYYIEYILDLLQDKYLPPAPAQEKARSLYSKKKLHIRRPQNEKRRPFAWRNRITQYSQTDKRNRSSAYSNSSPLRRASCGNSASVATSVRPRVSAFSSRAP